MGFWTAIVIIVTLACLTSVINAWLHQRQHRRDTDQREDSVEKRMEALDKELRERIANLERIVTDEQSDLARQFKDLERGQ